MPNHYEVMGLAPSATHEEIKKRFRELGRKFHPDKHAGNDLAELAAERFKEVTAANEVLSDPVKRAAYDRRLFGQASQEAAGVDEATGMQIGAETGQFLGRQLLRTKFGQQMEAGAKMMGAQDLPSSLAESGRCIGLGIAELLKKKRE